MPQAALLGLQRQKSIPFKFPKGASLPWASWRGVQHDCHPEGISFQIPGTRWVSYSYRLPTASSLTCLTGMDLLICKVERLQTIAQHVSWHQHCVWEESGEGRRRERERKNEEDWILLSNSYDIEGLKSQVRVEGGLKFVLIQGQQSSLRPKGSLSQTDLNLLTATPWYRCSFSPHLPQGNELRLGYQCY